MPPTSRWSRAAAWAGAAAIAVVQVYAAFARPDDDRLADLHVYVGAARLLAHGGSLYDFAVPGSGAPFTYPPFAGLLFLPLSYADEPTLRILWTLATLATVVAVARVATRLLGDLRLPAGLATPLATAVLLLSAPVSSDIRFGQVSVFLAAAVLYDARSGAPTGFTAAIKLTPGAFLPWYAVSGRRRAALIGAAVVAGSIGLGFALLPRDSTRYWFHAILDVQRVGNIQTGGNQSLNGALIRLGVPDGSRTALFAAGAVLVLAAAIWRARRLDPLTGALVVGAATVVASPVSWTHHQIWLVLAACAPLAAGRGWNALWRIGALLLMIAPITSYGSHLPGVIGAVLGESRLLLAVAIACVVPFRRTVGPTDPV